MLKGFRWRSIGPVGQGGRIDDIAVVENEPRTWYVGYATGGVWKTTNAGITFEPVFETYGTASIGAVAIAQGNPNVVYVGTGEGNGRNSASFGDGVYKSTDAGRTFTHVGLRESQSIQKIVVDPRNADVAYVAAVGHLYGPNTERGLFKTTNGGTSWNKTLYVDENTGVSDVVLDPSNPDIVYASTYQRRRASWGFNGGGPGSGIWKSEDAGAHFKQLIGSGLPGDVKGRIALDVARSNPNVVYAQIEVLRDEDRVADMSQATHSSKAEMGTDQAGGVWRSNDKGATWQFVSNHNVRPQYYSVLRVDPKNENVVYSVGRRFYRSEDGGKTFRVINGPGHGDYHAIWIDPRDSEHLMVGNDGGSDVSYDRGRTWEAFRVSPVGQFAGLSVDMQRPYYVYGGLQDNGNLAGPSAVRSDFISSHDWFNIGGGDGSFTGSDPTGQNYVYSEGQRGVMHRIEMRTGRIVAIQPNAPSADDPTTNVVPRPAPEEYRWNWSAPFVVSRYNSNVIYSGANRLFKSVDRGDTWTASPDLTKHVNTDTLSIMGVKGSAPYCHGTNVKIARGQQCILSKNDGTWFYSTLTAIDESPLARGFLWVGADDGALQYTRDDGRTWTNVTGNLSSAPQNCYVSRVEASNFDLATAYVSLDCHRNDDLRPYVYVTRDLGKTWTSISANLPAYGCVNVVRQDLKNRNLLFAGTEFGFFVSLDEGKSWKKFMTGLSTVRIDEIIVHPRDADLVIGTHGRSVLVMDDITPLQQLGGNSPATGVVLAAKPAGSPMDEAVHLFQPRNAVVWNRDTRLSRSLPAAKHFRGENAPPGTAISYHLKDAATAPVKIRITDPSGKVFRDMDGTGDAGMNRVQWNLQGNLDGAAPRRAAGEDEDAPRQAPQGPMAKPGTYRVTLTVNGRSYSQPVVVEKDVWNGDAKP
jgi:photosystem II stability/assembly factor-like uncharacterized protein